MRSVIARAGLLVPALATGILVAIVRPANAQTPDEPVATAPAPAPAPAMPPPTTRDARRLFQRFAEDSAIVP
jgi:hypothetical protein